MNTKVNVYKPIETSFSDC